MVHAQSYAARVANGNLMGVTVTNYGFLGNNFISRDPSMEYPLGAGFEHLIRGGLWIGAQSVDSVGAFTGVTTACLDGSQGQASQGSTEFSPGGNTVVRRSTLPTSQFFDSDAVSELDFVSSFHDSIPKRSDNNNENHRPLRVSIRQESYQWSNPEFRDFMILRYVIKPIGAPLSNVHVGLYAELASGNKGAQSSWPPSGWFRKAWLQYDASQRMLREHYCAAQPVPASCQLQVAPYWAGVQLLTPPIAGQAVTVAAWGYGPGSPLRDQDVERYALMSAGTIADLTHPDLMPQTGDPCEVIAVGPYASVSPGDSIVVDFALVGGAEVADIGAHGAAAQALHDAGYIAQVVPVHISLAPARVEVGRVQLSWFSADRSLAEAVVERADDSGAWNAIGTVEVDGAGYLRYDDRTITAGQRYGYRLAANGETFGETWVDVPAGAFALYGTRTNPSAAGDLRVEFALDSAAPARLELFDPAGRKLGAKSVGMLGSGRHSVALAPAVQVEPGIYFLRLSQGTRVLRSRVVVMP